MNIELSADVRDRLMRLATYLDTLPKNYDDFDMQDYFVGKNNDDWGLLERKYAVENGGVGACGTCACAVGHGPSAGILVPLDLIEKDYRGCWKVDWYSYGNLFTNDNSLLFEWLFSSDWTSVDNHHYGAAARIKYVLMGHEVPDINDFDDLGELKKTIPLYAPYRKRKYVALAENA